MKFENLKIAFLGATESRTSRSGNQYTIKDVAFHLPTDNADYPQGIACSTMNSDVIAVLDGCKVGDTIASAMIDFNLVEGKTGKQFTSCRLWSIHKQAQPVQQASAPVAPAQPVQATAPVQPMFPDNNDGLPF